MKLKKRTISFSTLILLLCSVLFQALSLACGKKAAVSDPSSILFLYINIWFIALLFFHGLQALFWNATLKFIPLSVAYPFNSLSILITAILGVFFFSENLSNFNIIGIFVIILGVFITSSQSKEVIND
ncbi:MAG: hypothetical protein COA79_17240 [Planctomycetota bacterium]|nr:MAG: hypothetical protein COA79_17240 [Planctomycetota bacterium]